MVAAVVLLAACSQARAQGVAPGHEPRVTMPREEKLLAAFDSVVPAQMAESHIPGAIMVIVKDGAIYASRGWGEANVITHVPATPEGTIFRIGSISKVFTATAIMQLIDREQLHLRDDVNDHLTAWKIPATYPEPIRVENLLTHTGGLDEINTGRKVDDAAKVKSLGEFLRDRVIRRQAPGISTSYSTYGVSLMGYLVETISRQSLASYFDQRIFQPLGMSHSSLGMPATQDAPMVATGYQYLLGHYKAAQWEHFLTFPASDVNVTGSDMAKFMIGHLEAEQGGSPLFSDSIARQMHAVHFRNDPQGIGFAFGFFEKRLNGYRAIQHSGSMDGYWASLWMWPEQRMGLFLAYNRETLDLETRVMRRFAARVLQPRRDTLDMEGVPWTKPILKDDLRRFVGRYRLDIWCHSCKGDRGYVPSPTDVTMVNDSTLSILGGRWMQVSPLRFRLMNGTLDTGELYVLFVADSTGRITKLISGTNVSIRETGGETKNIKTVSVSAGVLDKYTGQYLLPPYGTLTLVREGAALTTTLPSYGKVTLVPMSKTRFAIKEIDGEIEFNRHWWQARSPSLTVHRQGQPDAIAKRVK